MTFDELNTKLGGNEKQSDWNQHANGGGWVNKSAKVDASAYIGDNAIVWGAVSGDARVYGTAQVTGDASVSGTARVCGNTCVTGSACVCGNAYVFGDARVSGSALVSGNACVFGTAWVYGDARVSGAARVFGDARVSGSAWSKSPLFIIGSRFSLTNAKKGHIQIGCKCATFAWWRSKEALAFAKQNSFTAAEIKEYKTYIALFTKVGK